jgi:hypothetical protein
MGKCFITAHVFTDEIGKGKRYCSSTLSHSHSHTLLYSIEYPSSHGYHPFQADSTKNLAGPRPVHILYHFLNETPAHGTQREAKDYKRTKRN